MRGRDEYTYATRGSLVTKWMLRVGWRGRWRRITYIGKCILPTVDGMRGIGGKRLAADFILLMFPAVGHCHLYIIIVRTEKSCRGKDDKKQWYRRGHWIASHALPWVSVVTGWDPFPRQDRLRAPSILPPSPYLDRRSIKVGTFIRFVHNRPPYTTATNNAPPLPLFFSTVQVAATTCVRRLYAVVH